MPTNEPPRPPEPTLDAERECLAREDWIDPLIALAGELGVVCALELPLPGFQRQRRMDLLAMLT